MRKPCWNFLVCVKCVNAFDVYVTCVNRFPACVNSEQILSTMRKHCCMRNMHMVKLKARHVGRIHAFSLFHNLAFSFRDKWFYLICCYFSRQFLSIVS
jgi:hypothetical protein